MNFTFYVYAFSTGSGSGIHVFEDLDEALEAYRSDLAIGFGYSGPADLEAIEAWREADPTGLDVFLFEEITRSFSKQREQAFMRKAFLEMESLAKKRR